MTTQLSDGATRFMPFNQGSNGSDVAGGAGTTASPNEYATHYLWEYITEHH